MVLLSGDHCISIILSLCGQPTCILNNGIIFSSGSRMRRINVCVGTTIKYASLNYQDCQKICATWEPTFNFNQLIPCTAPKFGRYVTIQHQMKREIMTICELQVLATKGERLRRTNMVCVRIHQRMVYSTYSWLLKAFMSMD